ncbi:hypothetical protein GWI33_007249 [Rhynchophorus ferrugineus]|uniref:Uncharacterized protein n=1 Tax=Rhynchophorus ferrugineus TaxID=354439 RepID=A0A834MCB1_RHYFE|nr:hypothetical protein GWI33_007249 [Rhynchophorus ferrugineus]
MLNEASASKGGKVEKLCSRKSIVERTKQSGGTFARFNEENSSYSSSGDLFKHGAHVDGLHCFNINAVGNW